MKYSIILPVRNGGNHLKECVASIIAQTCTNFNLHVLDNCSTDGTSEWLQSLTDERIIYIPSTVPLSIEENWGRIKSIAKNEYITLIGHDDILLPDYLQTMEQLIAAYPTASLYQTHFNYIDEHGAFIKKCKPMLQNEDAAAFLKNFLTNNIDIMGTGFMMRSKDYDAVGGIPLNYPNLLFADVELWVRLTAISYKVTTPVQAFCYRLHNSTTKTTADSKLQLAFEECVFFLEKMKGFNNNCKIVIEENGLQFIQHNCVSLSHRLLRTPVKNRNGLSVKGFVSKCEIMAKLLLPQIIYKPNANFKILLAKIIDSNPLTRSIFLAIKKFFRKPLYK